MAIYSNSMASLINEEVLSEARYTPNLAGAYTIVAENEANYNKIMKAIGLTELQHLEESGVEVMYEAVDVKAIIDKVIAWFKAIPGKVMSALKKFTEDMKKSAVADNAWVAAHGKAILASDGSLGEQMEYKAFNGLNDTTDTAVKRVSTSLKETLKGYGYNFENLHSNTKVSTEASVEEIVKDMKVKASGGEDFQKSLTEKIIGQTTTMGSFNPSNLIKFIKDTKGDIAKANAACKEIVDTVNNDIRTLEGIKKNINSDNAGNAVENISKFITLNKERSNLIITANGIYVAAIRARRAQYKKMGMLMIKNSRASKKEEKKSTNESVSFVHSFEEYVGSIC